MYWRPLQAQTSEAKFYFFRKNRSCKIMQSKHIETYTTKDINHEDQRKEYGQAKRLSKSSPHLLENKMNLTIDKIVNKILPYDR